MMLKALAQRLTYILTVVALVLQGPTTAVFAQQVPAQPTSGSKAQTPEPGISQQRPISIRLSPDIERLSNLDPSKVAEVTDSKSGAKVLFGFTETSAAELRKYSPEAIQLRLQRVEFEYNRRRQSFSNMLNGRLAELEKILQPIAQKSDNARQLLDAVRGLRATDLDRLSVGEIKSIVRDLKSRAASTNPLPAQQREAAVKALFQLQKQIVRVEYTNNQQFKAANQSKNVFIQTAMRLPMESVFFNIAMGLVMSIQMAANYQENPMALQQLLEGLKKADTHAGFYAFMVANAAVTPHLHRMISNPKLHFFIPYMGMSTGMMASSAVHDLYSLVAHKGLVGCVSAKLNGLGDQAEEKACASAYEDLVMNRKIVQYGASLTSLIGATAISGLAQKGLTSGAKKTAQLATRAGRHIPAENIIRLAGVKVMAKLTPAGWVLDVGHAIGKVGQFTGFLGADVAIQPLVRRQWGNTVYGEDLKHTEKYMVSYLEKESPHYNPPFAAEAWKDECEGISYVRSLRQRNNPNCQNVLTELSNFKAGTKDWHEFLLEKANATHAAWLDKVTHAMNVYGSSETFYRDFAMEVVEYRDLYGKGIGISPLERQMPLNGLRPYYLPDGFDVIYIDDMDYIMVQRLLTLQQTLAHMDGQIQASEQSRSSRQALAGKVRRLISHFQVSWHPFENPEQKQKRNDLWLRGLSDLTGSMTADPQLALLLSPLKMMGLTHRQSHQIPFRMTYSLLPFLTGVISGLEKPLTAGLPSFKELRKKLSIQGSPKDGDSIAAAIITAQALALNPTLAEEFPKYEIQLAESQTAEDYTRLLRENPSSLMHSYVATINQLIQIRDGKAPVELLPISNISYLLKKLGDPKPLMTPGAGYLASYSLAHENSLVGTIPVEGAPHGATLSDFFVYSMICGPDAQKSEDNFSHNRYGFSDRFYPPTLAQPSHQQLEQSICQARTKNISMDAIYRRAIPGLKSPDGSKSITGPIEYLMHYARPEAVSADTQFSDWWNRYLLPQLEEAATSYGKDYDKVAAQMLDDFLQQDDNERLNRSNLSNSALEALQQQRRLYTSILGGVVTAARRGNPQNTVDVVAPTDRPQDLVTLNPEASLLENLRQGEVFDLSPYIARNPNLKSQSIYTFQTELTEAFVQLEGLLSSVQYGFKNRESMFGWLVDKIRLKEVTHLERGFTKADVDALTEALDQELSELKNLLGYPVDAQEVFEATDVQPIALTDYQKAVVKEAVDGLELVKTKIVTLANIMTALEYTPAE